MILSSRGFLSRIFSPLFQLVTESWHMFLPGFLFGLGFDTATEVAMFGVAATQATKGISLGAILTLPACAVALFAAGACNRQVRARNGPGAVGPTADHGPAP